MAAANESQGLKIAVAVFVMLTVIFAVSTYFAYTNYAATDAKLTQAEGKATQANKAASDALNQVDALRKEIGARAEDTDAVKAEIKKEYQKIDDQLKGMIDQVNEAVTKAQASGAQGAELEDAKTKVQSIAAAYRSEPNKTYISALARMTELLSNLSMLATRLSLNYVDVKRNLEGANSVNAEKLEEQVKAVNAAKTDLTGEHEKHENERQSLIARLDKFQTENASLQARIATLEGKLRESEDDFTKKLATAQLNVREWRDRVERKETILERPDGTVTYVDYNRGEIHTSLNRGMGARPQMQLTIFDSQSPGLPTDKPKGSVELISVNDRFSIARITKTNSSIEPIRVGDYVYSAAWSPNEPMRFALIGKIDINRDGRDDRADLKRMIAAAGGIVDYDLPPPDAGKESGKLTGRDAWYVIDERPPLRQVYGKSTVTESENADFLKRQTEAVRDARLNGVRPMPIERLLPFLGYDYLAPVRGRAEAIDVTSQKRLLAPRQDADKPRAAAPSEPEPEPKADEAAPKEKEEMPKDESK